MQTIEKCKFSPPFIRVCSFIPLKQHLSDKKCFWYIGFLDNSAIVFRLTFACTNQTHFPAVAAKKKTLVVTPFDDICVLALSTPLKDYKLAWHLNEVLRLDLKKMAGLQIAENPGVTYSFYYYDAGENLNIFNLLQLQSEGLKLLKLPVPVDFLLIIRNTIPEGRMDDWLNAIRSIPGLTVAFSLEVEKYKQIDPVLEMIEIHEFNLLREQVSRR